MNSGVKPEQLGHTDQCRVKVDRELGKTPGCEKRLAVAATRAFLDTEPAEPVEEIRLTIKRPRRARLDAPKDVAMEDVETWGFCFWWRRLSMCSQSSGTDTREFWQFAGTGRL